MDPLLCPHVADTIVKLPFNAVDTPTVRFVNSRTQPFASVTVTLYVPEPNPGYGGDTPGPLIT